MLGKDALRWWFAVAMIAVAGFGLGRMMRSPVAMTPEEGPPGEGLRSSLSALGTRQPVSPDFTVALAARGSDQVTEMFEALRGAASNAELEQLAKHLLADEASGSSSSLWALLLARWSEVDPAAMVAFVDGRDGHAALPAVLELAFLAWGAVDAEGAFEAVRSRPEKLRWAALRGMAERDPSQAAEWALRMPDAQFALRQVVKAGGLSEETLRALLPRCVYDGSRQPLQEEMVARLAETDPAAAVAAAQRAGRTWDDPVAKAVSEIARHDPEAAISEWAKLPDSRQRALSSVSLVKAWAGEDPGAAERWARASLPTPVLHSALLEIAAMIGGQDPRAGLALVDEVGWGEVGKFYDIVRYEKGVAQHPQSHEHTRSLSVATAMVRQLAITDPEAARAYIAGVTDGVRDELTKAAGFSAPAP